MDPLGDMTLFVAVARARSFSAASKAVGTPISSLSRRIAALEERLGTRLLQRSSRKVELTEQGRLYLDRSVAILEAVSQAADEVREATAVPRGRLRVSMPPSFGELFLAPLFAEYSKRYPDVALELDLSTHLVDLVAERFDLAIRIGKQSDSSMATRRITSVRMALFASDAYLRRHGEPAEPRELEAHDCLRLLRSGPSSDAWELQSRGRRVSLRVRGRMATNHTGMLLRMARQGLGIALLDELVVVDDVESGALRRVLGGWTAPPVPVCAVTPSKVLPARTRLLLDCLREHIAVVRRRLDEAV